MLKIDLGTDPCGTLFIISVQKLKAVLIFFLCQRLIK